MRNRGKRLRRFVNETWSTSVYLFAASPWKRIRDASATSETWQRDDYRCYLWFDANGMMMAWAMQRSTYRHIRLGVNRTWLRGDIYMWGTREEAAIPSNGPYRATNTQTSPSSGSEVKYRDRMWNKSHKLLISCPLQFILFIPSNHLTCRMQILTK
jgi:hypothetical protein